jgi:hypothetical protein
MLSPLFSTMQGNVESETESESPTEESTTESNSPGLISLRVRELRVALSSELSLPLTSAGRRSGWHRADSGDFERCRGSAARLALRC